MGGLGITEIPDRGEDIRITSLPSASVGGVSVGGWYEYGWIMCVWRWNGLMMLATVVRERERGGEGGKDRERQTVCISSDISFVFSPCDQTIKTASPIFLQLMIGGAILMCLSVRAALPPAMDMG